MDAPPAAGHQGSGAKGGRVTTQPEYLYCETCGRGVEVRFGRLPPLPCPTCRRILTWRAEDCAGQREIDREEESLP